MRIAILTSFDGWRLGYSLTGILTAQMRMFTKYGHDVAVLVREDFDGNKKSGVLPHLPATKLVDYSNSNDISTRHIAAYRKTKQVLIDFFADFKPDVVITHDWALTGWNLPYFMGALLAADETPSIPFYHWIHSLPNAGRNWWDHKRWPGNHTIVYPNKTDLLRVAEAYQTTLDNCLTIPHTKDPADWFGFEDETKHIIDKVPGLLSSDIVQILPISSDRLEAKKLGEVIKIFSNIKKLKRSICLFVANSNSGGNEDKIDKYRRLGKKFGLSKEELIFSSDIKSDYALGISNPVVMNLFLLSNLFIFPTDHESFGLVVPEAMLSGVLPVLNGSLDMQREVSGNNGLFFEFGCYHQKIKHLAYKKRVESIAGLIISHMEKNEVLRAKTFARQQYSLDAVYQKYYASLLTGSENARCA